MRVDELLNRLERVKHANGSWTARCPAHEDNKSSLGITEGDDGRILLVCRAGCDTEHQVCPALGIELRDLFPEPAPMVGGFNDRVEATYDYRDEDGSLLYQAVRLRDPKDFRQRQPDGDGWAWHLKGVRRILYRLPLDERAVWICEGEKDADTLIGLGFQATTNPMGAGSWQDTYTETLKDCPWVLVVADCDEPGRKHAETVARSVHQAGVPVKVIDLASDRDDGYDLSDYLAEHGDTTPDLLRELARTTPRWSPESANRPVVPIQGVRQFIANIPPYDEAKDYLGPLLHGGYRIHVAGPIGHGKTSLLLEAMSAALRGSEFLGWRGKGDLKGLHIDLEMPGELLGQAVRDARLEDVEGFSLLHLPDGLEVDTNQQHRRILETACERFDIVTIDPWYKLLGNELEYSAARGVVSLLDGIRQRHQNMCMMVGFHAQEPETPSAPVTLGNISGFKFFQRPADIVLTFQRLRADTSRIMWEKNRSPRLDVKKGEKWVLEWERGKGFHRVKNRKGEGAEVFELFPEVAA